MLQQFLNHLSTIPSVQRGDRFLLAVSGGVDSMVMLDLFTSAGLSIGVAHCNFQLRPEEAAEEQRLVEETCDAKNIPFFARSFETASHASEHGISTQLAARNLRYEYFEQLRSSEQFNWIATAHHLNDSFETILLNLVRGTGMDGLSGIPMINGHTIRPMLFLLRDEIERYASEKRIAFRTDSSNLKSDYARNLIRNKAMPLLREINPGLDGTLESTITRLTMTRHLLDTALQEFFDRAVTIVNGQTSIDRKLLMEHQTPALVLWEILKRSGFAFEECRKIVQTSQVGKVFSSRSHELLVDRESLILAETKHKAGETIELNLRDHTAVRNGVQLELKDLPVGEVIIEKDPALAFFDLDKLSFPLVWREWRSGDRFIPLGMTAHKKLSDFFIDKKVDRFAKSDMSVIESGGEIIWVVGVRVSESVKVTASTRRVLVLRVLSGEGDETQVI